MPSVDTKLDCFDTYFDEDIYLDDLINMTEEEREAYFKQLIDANDLTEEEQAEFQAALDTELSDLYTIVYEQSQQLEAIIESDLSTASDVAAAEASLTECDAIMPYLTGDISSDWGDAEEIWADQNIEVSSGEDHTHSVDDPENGATYTVTVVDDTSDSSFEDDETLGDLDGDGYNDDVMVDENGVALDDWDGDGVITEADATYDPYGDTSAVTIDLDEGDSIEMSSYDAETETVTFKITKADGTEYYLTIVGEADIYCSVLPTNLESMPEDVTARMYEYADSEHSNYYYLEGHEQEEYDSYYSIYQTSDSTNNTLEIDEPSAEDWTNERSYTITMQDNVADTLTLNFGDDVTLEFGEGPNGELIIYATNAEGQTITITIENWSTETDDEGDMDAININGGIIDESDYSDLAAIANGMSTGSATYLSSIVANLIHHNGDDDSIYEDAVDDGYDWASVVPS